MKPIEWNEKISIDGDLIDSDHRFLLDIINKFRTGVGGFETPAEALDILESLKSYSQSHFFREEQLQSASGFPKIAAHKQEHINLINRLEDVISNTQKASLEDINTTAGTYISDFLFDWLINHVLKCDTVMKPHVRQMKDAAASLDRLRETMQND